MTKNRVKHLTIRFNEFEDEGKQYSGKVQFSNKHGEVHLDIDNEFCLKIINLSIKNIASTCKEQIKELNEVFMSNEKMLELNEKD